MIPEDLGNDELRDFCRKAGIPEPEMFTWRNPDGTLVGLMTGEIHEYESCPGLSAYLKHIVVLPDAVNRMEVLFSMPCAIEPILIERGVKRIFLSIDHNFKRARLGKYAELAGFSKYEEREDSDWYIKVLPERNTQ